MKKNFNTIISLITCAALVICIFQIKSLESEIDDLKRSMAQRVENISMEIDSVYYNIDNKLEQQARLITDDSWQIVSADIENNSVEVECSVTAKEYIPGVTQAFVFVNGQEYELSLVNGQFTGTIMAPLFEDTEVEAVSFRENGIVRNQPLDWRFFPRYDYLTIVYADLNWSGRGSKSESRDNMYQWKLEDGEISIDFDRQIGEIDIRSMDMVEMINGVEVKRTPIPLDSQAIVKENGLFHSTESVRPEYADVQDLKYRNISYDISGYVFEIPFGSTLDVYVETLDGDGLVHRNQIAQWNVSEDGKGIGEYNEWWHGAEGFIYDTAGNLIYGNEELYK